MLRNLFDSSIGRLPVMIVVLGLVCLTSNALAGGGRLLKTDTSKQNVIPDETPPPALSYTAGNLVVKLYASDSLSIEQVNSQYGTTVDKYLANLRLYLLAIPEGADPDLLAAEISASPWVEYAQPNYITDPLNPVQGSYPFPDMTHEGNFDGQEAAALLQLASVHQVITGAGVTVGVLDGGVDYTHPRFNGRVVSGWDYVDDDADAMDEAGGDNSGHGTFVAGVVALVAPDATIRAYRVSDVDGSSEGYLLAEAIMQAVADGCDIINLSLAMTHSHAAVGDALAYAASNGVLAVAAAGNGGIEEVRYPASDPNALAVAAIDSLGLLAEFSNYGSQVDVCAPGAWIYSPFQDDGYAWWDGTSFAAPFVAGQAALLAATRPTASVGQLRGAILLSADDLDLANPAYAGKLGQGLIDPLASLDFFAGSDSAGVSPDTISLSVPLGTMDTILVAALVTSSNAPAAYTAEVLNTGDRFVQLLQSTGMTNDSLLVAVFPGWPFSGGLWHNTISIMVEGTNAPVELVIELNLTSSGGGESAWVIPDVIEMVIPYGWLGMASSPITVHSTNEPAFYSVSGGSFAIVQDSTGLTGDSTYVHLDPTGLSLGTHCDTLLFNVVGIPVPAPLVVCLTITADTTGPASAWTTPSSLSFTLPLGSDTASSCVTVNSTNAPAAFSIQYNPFGFVTVSDTLGMTNGNACVTVDPTGYGVGSYCDSILIFVDSISGPIALPVCMTITDSSSTGADSAWAWPSFVSVQVLEGNNDTIMGCINIGSTNQPAPLYGDILRPSQPPDVQLVYPWDTTPGSLCYIINATGLAAGTYCDTIRIAVLDVDMALVVPVCVTVLPDSGGGGGGDSTLIAAYPSQFSVALSENGPVLERCLLLTSDNQPAAYSVTPAMAGGANFITVPDSSGMTPDSVCFQIDPGTLSPGSYCDSLVVWVSGAGYPLMVPVCLTIVPDSSGGGGADSSWAIPGAVSFYEPFGADTAIECFSIYSTNQPATFSIWDDSNSIFSVTDPSGLTGQGACVIADPAGLDPGIYCDTLQIYVEGIAGLLAVPICLTVTSGDTLPAFGVSLEGNYPNPFNPETNISFSLPSAMDVQLTVYNVLGQRIRTLLDQEMTAGRHVVRWDGTSDGGQAVASGIYFYRLTTGVNVETRKMMLLK